METKDLILRNWQECDAEESVQIQGALTFANVGTGAMFAGVIIGQLATELFIWITSIEMAKVMARKLIELYQKK